MARLVVPASRVEAARERARLAARAAITARLHEPRCSGCPTTDGYVAEACWSAPADALDEAIEVALTATRLAAAALGCEPPALLGALLVARTAAAYEPAEQVRREAEGR